MDWSTILTASVTGSIVTILCNWFLESKRGKEKIRREATYAALRASTALEGFAISCAEEIERYLSSDSPDEYMNPGFFTVPDYQGDSNWRAVDLDLANRALTFVNAVTLTRLMIIEKQRASKYDKWSAYAYGDEVSNLGIMARDLAAELRMRYNIPADKLRTQTWDYVLALESESLRMVRYRQSIMRDEEEAEQLDRLRRPLDHPP